MTTNPVIPRTFACCCRGVTPGVPGFDQGWVCSVCNRVVVCRSCLARVRSMRQRKPVCRDCAATSTSRNHLA